jgi:CDGSH-type Zn-finger protein
MTKPNGAKITIVENGPYVVEGSLPLAKQHIVINEQGESLGWREGESFPQRDKCSLCRCGQSANKPYCDGSHTRAGFDGTETASRAPFAEQAQTTDGPTLVLDDADSLCASGRFCDPHGQVWNLVQQSDQPRAAQLTIQEAGLCPAGRLVARHRANGVAIEPRFDPSLGLVEDTAEQVSGPIWVRGGVPVVGADGHTYEVRNRVTLCRCGASKNKPFCDGMHRAIRFDDGA